MVYSMFLTGCSMFMIHFGEQAIYGRHYRHSKKVVVVELLSIYPPTDIAMSFCMVHPANLHLQKCWVFQLTMVSSLKGTLACLSKMTWFVPILSTFVFWSPKRYIQKTLIIPTGFASTNPTRWGSSTSWCCGLPWVSIPRPSWMNWQEEKGPAASLGFWWIFSRGPGTWNRETLLPWSKQRLKQTEATASSRCSI